MRTENAVTILREDYRAPDFKIHNVDLSFDLDADRTTVTCSMHVERARGTGSLQLHGDQLRCISISIDGSLLPESAYRATPDSLEIFSAPDQGKITVVNEIAPAANKALMGLYASNGMLTTQCEAEGFRRITYFLDRPDVMARYRVTLRADKALYPVLLSNGNLISTADLPDGRHQAVWEDPFPKPSYLFALVAGQLVARERQIVTDRGKHGLLQVWTRAEDHAQTEHALDSLEHSIRWDEARFGLPLDLERFMIVAVSDFNMGAMENKGLNIFNTKFVLADPQTATDDDYLNIEAVVGHEYFHNWTGNRVTCRDWFQLTLKEGLTVFRDQEFTADRIAAQVSPEQVTSARAVKRIDDVQVLRSAQFPEDAGPMAHPIRPDSYREINNFYTVTVYEKGAEVVRMLQTLLGRDGFARGMKLYFDRHDGQAVTCDDFVAAMLDAIPERGDSTGYQGLTKADLASFDRWYQQAGTPRVRVSFEHDPVNKTLTLNLTQRNSPEPLVPTDEDSALVQAQDSLPLLLPFAFGLIDSETGRDVPLFDVQGRFHGETTAILPFKTRCEQVILTGIERPVVPSLLRNFSAPVIVEVDYQPEDWLFLLAHDSDPFNRWEAGQRLMTQTILAAYDALRQGLMPQLPQALVPALGAILADRQLDPAFVALVLAVPTESYLLEQLGSCDPGLLRQARHTLRLALAKQLAGVWRERFDELTQTGPYSPDPTSAGKRALRNLALAMLARTGLAGQALAAEAYACADNMTDRLAALHALVDTSAAFAADALADFATRHDQHALALDKWFMLQATRQAECGLPATDDVHARPAAVKLADTLGSVRALLQHPRFQATNPNKVRALVGAFVHNNLAEFHRPDGQGYQFWADQVLAIDPHNPQVAARLARAMDRWQKFDAPRRAAMRDQIQRVAECASLSNDVREVVENALRAGQG